MVSDLSKTEQQKEIDELKQELREYQVKLKMRNARNSVPKKFIQYTTKFGLEEHQALQKAVKWLNENGFLKETSKYQVTKYALRTLVDIVESRKKKAELVKHDANQDNKQGVKQNDKQDTKRDTDQAVKKDATRKVVS